MKTFLSMAALALVGAMMTGCSSDDSIIDNPQPVNQSKLVTLTTTVGLDGGATTRALTSTGTKTFAEGDQIAVIYTKNGGTVTKAVSVALPAGDYGANATFTVTLDDPDRTQDVTYIYPAAMAGETGVDYTKLNSQTGGTLADLGSKYDLCTNSGAWNAGALPSLTLNNQLAILAITLKDIDGSNTITSTITGMTISDGTNNYAVTRSAAAGPIYVAIQPTTDAQIWISATDGTKTYIKKLTKTYATGNGYNVSWKMATFGNVIASNGNFYASATAATTDGTTAVAVITYVGSATGEDAPYTHGLALAMSDANNGSKRMWRSSTGDAGHTRQFSSSFTSESGLQYNDAMHNLDMYPAFKYARANNGTAAPTGCSAWFLPTGYQFNQMRTAAGSSSNLLNCFSSVGGTNMKSTSNNGYWVASEYNPQNAWLYVTSVYTGSWENLAKNQAYNVRSAIAF